MSIFRRKKEAIDELDVLASAWVLSCLDENPIMTYRGVIFRLNLPKDFDIRGLLGRRRELFRPGLPSARLDQWKSILRQGRARPSWILEISDDVEQKKQIDAITPSDIFRNQFRMAVDAPKCDLPIITWGLEHIERLRKSAAESREEKIKRVSLIAIPLVSSVIALASLFGTLLIQKSTSELQFHMKRYEVSFKPKQESYTSFVTMMFAAYEAASNDNRSELRSRLNAMDAAYLAMEPFLEESANKILWSKYQEFTGFCFAVLSRPAGTEPDDRKFVEYRNAFRSELYQNLFGHQQSKM